MKLRRKRGNEDFESKKMRENRMRSDKSLLINESVARHTEKGQEGRKWKERDRVGDYEKRAGNKMKRMGFNETKEEEEMRVERERERKKDCANCD